ncbi:membrane protein [Paenibacillus swuensis]|uniref:Membrane protein n=1 Tax=Paenibacillus swuensis TaxID=1178515 RepID=A0A172TFQ2_9BACL|nr:hypothetical protein [Paenibacillus swuensis]ANE45613.1 membrane protein [Paenibacillus swuensis]
MNYKGIFGLALMILGLFLFLNNGDSFSTGDVFSTFWPTLFVFPVSLFLHWLYFGMIGPKGVGLVVPAGVLTVVAIVCQIATLFDNWSVMWPGFLLAPALGLLELYIFGGRNKFLLIPVTVLTSVSIVFFASFSLQSIFNSLTGQPVIAIVMILIGALALISGGRKAER